MLNVRQNNQGGLNKIDIYSPEKGRTSCGYLEGKAFQEEEIGKCKDPEAGAARKPEWLE